MHHISAKASDAAGSKTGNVANGGKTDDTTPTLSGKAEAGSVVTIYDGLTKLGSVTAGADGKWTFTPASSLKNGGHSFNVSATDKAGNTSEKSNVWNVNIQPDVHFGSETYQDKNPVVFQVGKDYVIGDVKYHVYKEGFKPGMPLGVWNSGGNHVLTLGLDGSMKIDVGPTNYFEIEARGFDNYPPSSFTIDFFDMNGKLIGSQSVSGKLGDPWKKLTFTAAEGLLIGHMILSCHDDFGLMFDNLKWGKVVSSTEVVQSLSNGEMYLDYIYEDINEIDDVNSEIKSYDHFKDDAILNKSELLFNNKELDLNLLKLSERMLLEENVTFLINFNDGDVTPLVIKGNNSHSLQRSALLKDGTDLGDWSQVAGSSEPVVEFCERSRAAQIACNAPNRRVVVRLALNQQP
ncbi:MAG: hypothetical protein FT714_13100 [Pantoea sp. Pent]|nr:hypothetical protein [Pantoea sp. Pent]